MQGVAWRVWRCGFPVLVLGVGAARLEKLPRAGATVVSPRRVAGLSAGCRDGVWVLFENSTVCFVCDSAKFFVWLRPFHIPVVGVAFLNSQFLVCFAWIVLFVVLRSFYGEFDPGSGRTLAACLTHASRTVRPFRGYTSGERVSNTWVICPALRDKPGKLGLIPDMSFHRMVGVGKFFGAG